MAWLGALIGAAGGLIGNELQADRAKNQGPQVQTSIPWEAQSPYLQYLFSEASRLYSGGTDVGAGYAPATGGGGSGNDKFVNTRFGKAFDPLGEWLLQPEVQRQSGGYRASYSPAALPSGVTGAGGQSLVPSLSPDTLMAIALARDIAANQFNRYGDIQQAQQFGLKDVLSPTSNPYLQQYMEAVTRPVMQQLQEQVLPGLTDEAIIAGQFGGTRPSLAQAQAVERATRAALDATTRLGSEAYGRGLNTFERTLALTPVIQQAQLAPLELLYGAGSIQEQHREKQLLDPWRRLQLFQGIIGGQQYGRTTSTTQPQPYSNPFSSALGGATAGYGLWKDIFNQKNTSSTPGLSETYSDV